MKKLLIFVAVSVFILGWFENDGISIVQIAEAWAEQGSEQLLNDAYRKHRSDFQIQGQATVAKLLGDDNKGSQHQRFLIRTSLGQTLLVAHNIDLAPRIDNLKEGDSIEFFGEYEWNDKGGVIHWTHRDPGGRHVAGWIKHAGELYQ